jgi:hypothetical protein
MLEGERTKTRLPAVQQNGHRIDASSSRCPKFRPALRWTDKFRRQAVAETKNGRVDGRERTEHRDSALFHLDLAQLQRLLYATFTLGGGGCG